MRGKTHCTIGILVALEASILLKFPISILNLIISGIFSILPDLDESNSLISNLFFNKKASKFLYKALIYLINIIIFFASLKINENFFISSIFTFIIFILIEPKITHSFLRKLFLTLLFLLLSYCLYLTHASVYFILFILMLATFPWLKHRTFSHSLLSIFVIYFLLKEIESIINISHISFFATLGYASHTFLGDLFTKQGVPLFYPISNKKISFGCFKVGSYVCNLAEIITILILLGLIFFSIIII